MKQLRQMSTGRIFTWTEALSKRNDMVLHNPDAAGLVVVGMDNKDSVINELRCRVAELEASLEEALKQKKCTCATKKVDDRQSIINDAVAEILKEKNPNDFTITGVPKLPAIMERCTVYAVTAAERDTAIEAFNKSVED